MRDPVAAAAVQNCLLIKVKSFIRICAKTNADDTYPAVTFTVAVDIAGLSTVSKSQHQRACSWKKKTSTLLGCCHRQCSSHVVIWMEGQQHGQPTVGSLPCAVWLGRGRAGTPPHPGQAGPAAAACGLMPSARVTQQPRWLCCQPFLACCKKQCQL